MNVVLTLKKVRLYINRKGKARISKYKTFDFRMFPDFALRPLMSKIGDNYYDDDSGKIPVAQVQELLWEYNRDGFERRFRLRRASDKIYSTQGAGFRTIFKNIKLYHSTGNRAT